MGEWLPSNPSDSAVEPGGSYFTNRGDRIFSSRERGTENEPKQKRASCTISLESFEQFQKLKMKKTPEFKALHSDFHSAIL